MHFSFTSLNQNFLSILSPFTVRHIKRFPRPSHPGKHKSSQFFHIHSTLLSLSLSLSYMFLKTTPDTQINTRLCGAPTSSTTPRGIPFVRLLHAMQNVCGGAEHKSDFTRFSCYRKRINYQVTAHV